MSRIEELEKMLDQNPDDPFLIYALAREYEARQSTMQAVLMYEHLVTNYSDYIATYYHYARLLYNGGNRLEGMRLIKQGIEAGTKAKDMHAVGEMKGLLQMWEDD